MGNLFLGTNNSSLIPGTTWYADRSDDSGLALVAHGTSAPPSTADTFQRGCIGIRTDGTTGTSLYKNDGTSASPSWTLIDAVIASEIALAEGNLLIGDNSGVATALDIGTTDGGVAIGDGTTATVAAMSGDVTMTNAGVASIGANKVTSAKTDVELIQHSEYALTGADILAMNGTPVEILATGGVGTAIIVHNIMMIYDYDTAAYTNGGDITIEYSSGGATLSATVAAADMFGASGDKVAFVPSVTVDGVAPVNTGVSITNATGAFTDPGTAVGVGRIHVWYSVITTDL